MRDNRVKDLLSEGKPVIGSVISLAEPFVAEVMASVGFDFILIDKDFLRTYVFPILKTQESKNLKNFYSDYLIPVYRYHNFILYQLSSL